MTRVPLDADYPRISASESAFNPDTDIIFHICQYPYSNIRCGYRYGKGNNWSISDLISEDWVLDNDIRMENTILQWNDAIDFDILSWWKNNSENYPILVRVARDILGILTSIVVSKSAFSTGSHVIHCYRSRMTMGTGEALICTW